MTNSVPTIKNIIFDLGGVILNIDPQRTVQAFRDLGWKDLNHQDHTALSNDIFFHLERGESTPEGFRAHIRKIIRPNLTDQQIDEAWTSMILDIPADRVNYLLQLKSKYRLFLLSNTNEIHRVKFHHDFERDFGYSFYDLFEKSFYSHEMGMRKPDTRIYLKALQEGGIAAEQTLFVDDIKVNTEAAHRAGMKVLHIEPGTMPEKLQLYLKGDIY